MVIDMYVRLFVNLLIALRLYIPPVRALSPAGFCAIYRRIAATINSALVKVLVRS
jgi:hypothetical protein